MMRAIATIACMLTSVALTHGQNVWWWPDMERFGFGRHVDYEGVERGVGPRSAWIRAATERDRDLMAGILELFPIFMLDSSEEQRPGTGPPNRGEPSVWGYIVLVDGKDVTLIVPEDKARELVTFRITGYLVLRELVTLWAKHGGYDDVRLHVDYVPWRREPITVAIAYMTEFGVKVIMGR